MKKDTATMFRLHLSSARAKHPRFPRSFVGKALVLLEEVFELLWAMAFESSKRVREESGDVAAVIVRIVEGD